MVHGELWGIAAEGWIAIATIFGGFAVLASGAAVLFGFFHGAKEVAKAQEATDVRRYLLDEGGMALKAGLDGALEMTRLNHAIVLRLLLGLKFTPPGHPFAPRPEDIPRLLPTEHPKFNFHAIAPASRLTGCTRLGELMTSAFADIYSTNIAYEFEIRQPVVRCYEGADLSGIQFEEWKEAAFKTANDVYMKAEKFGPVSNLLGDAVLRAQELHLARTEDIGRIQSDPTMAKIKKQLDALADEAAKSSAARKKKLQARHSS